MTRAVQDALSDALPEDLQQPVLRAALGLAGQREVPEDPEGAAWFVHEPLRMALTHYLGETRAEEVLYTIPVHELFGSHARARRRPRTDPATIPSPPPTSEEVPAAEPRVVVASHDRASILRLARRLTGRGQVTPVTELADLRAQLSAGHDAVVVLDGCTPTVDSDAMAWALLDAEPGPKLVLVWGSRGPRSHGPLVPGMRRWVHLPVHTTPDDLAEVILSVL